MAPPIPYLHYGASLTLSPTLHLQCVTALTGAVYPGSAARPSRSCGENTWLRQLREEQVGFCFWSSVSQPGRDSIMAGSRRSWSHDIRSQEVGRGESWCPLLIQPRTPACGTLPPTITWVFQPLLISLDDPSQAQPEVCLLGDSRTCPVGSVNCDRCKTSAGEITSRHCLSTGQRSPPFSSGRTVGAGQRSALTREQVSTKERDRSPWFPFQIHLLFPGSSMEETLLLSSKAKESDFPALLTCRRNLSWEVKC